MPFPLIVAALGSFFGGVGLGSTIFGSKQNLTLEEKANRRYEQLQKDTSDSKKGIEDVQKLLSEFAVQLESARKEVQDARKEAQDARGEQKSIQRSLTELIDHLKNAGEAQDARAGQPKATNASDALREKIDDLVDQMNKLEKELKKDKGQEWQLVEKNLVREKKRKNGDRPTDHVTEEEFKAKKAEYQYDSNLFHIAVAGNSGSGKTSLINAFRGLTDSAEGAAVTDVVECTQKVERYPGHNPFVWFDIPGAGTRNIPAMQYFNQQGLYIFDCIIVLVDIRFTESDIWILEQCKLVKPEIPTFIVRSKSDQHIMNTYNGRIEDSELELGSASKAEIRARCKAEYVAKTKESVRKNLQIAGLDEAQRVYMVSRNVVRTLQKGEQPKQSALLLDEKELIYDIIAKGSLRRAEGLN
jgi:GTP-binding protein EngB required for normal cell division